MTAANTTKSSPAAVDAGNKAAPRFHDRQQAGRALVSCLSHYRGYPSLLVLGLPRGGVTVGFEVARALDAGAFATETGKPVVIVTPQPKVARKFRDAGLPVFTLESEAIAALDQFIRSHEVLAQARLSRGSSAALPVIREANDEALQEVLNEADGLSLAAAHGLPVVAHRLCRTEEEAVEALAFLGGRVAVKGCTAAVTHKSDVGLVQLDVGNAKAVRTSFRTITAKAKDQHIQLDGVLLARMASGRREIIIGAHRDPTFGAVLTVGDGGKYVEQLPDVQVLLAEATRDEVLRAIGRLRIAPVLAGVRGEAPMDTESLCDAVLALGRLMNDGSQHIYSIDLNPVMLFDAG